MRNAMNCDVLRLDRDLPSLNLPIAPQTSFSPEWSDPRALLAELAADPGLLFSSTWVTPAAVFLFPPMLEITSVLQGDRIALRG